MSSNEIIIKLVNEGKITFFINEEGYLCANYTYELASGKKTTRTINTKKRNSWIQKENGGIITIDTNRLICMYLYGTPTHPTHKLTMKNSKLGRRIDNFTVMSQREISGRHGITSGNPEWVPRFKKYRIRIFYRELIYLGIFNDKEEAVEIYNKAKDLIEELEKEGCPEDYIIKEVKSLKY